MSGLEDREWVHGASRPAWYTKWRYHKQEFSAPVRLASRTKGFDIRIVQHRQSHGRQPNLMQG